jgi:hypothetical protein
VRALTPLRSKIRRRNAVVVHDSDRLVASSVFDAALCSRSISHNPHADEHDPSACGGQLLIVGMNDSDVISGLMRKLQMTRREQRGNCELITFRGRVVGRPALNASVIIQGRVRRLWYSCSIVARHDGREQCLLIL